MARHHARELALKILFEYDLAHVTLPHVLERTLSGASVQDGEYARRLVEGTVADKEQLDRWIAEASKEWRVSRMPTIDRNILRLASYEIVHQGDVPLSVIINEAVELAQSYSTAEAKRFVNGVLGSIAEKIRPEGDRDRPSQ